MGTTTWYEETNKPKQAIIKEALGDFKVKRSRWNKGGGIVVQLANSYDGEDQCYIPCNRGSRPKWSKEYFFWHRDPIFKGSFANNDWADENIKWYK